MSKNEVKEGSKKQKKEKEGNKQEEEGSKKGISLGGLIKENIKLIQSNPNLANELYQSLINRVRRNLHFILTFTPSGQNFRTKM